MAFGVFEGVDLPLGEHSWTAFVDGTW
eukprot:COSAG05_NODE_1628_length_4372_cov_213.628047_6_plen_26_part_01